MAFKSKATPGINVAATPTVVTDTVAAGATQTVIGMSLCNVVTSAVTVSAKLNKQSGVSSFLIKDAIVPAGGALVIVGGDQKVVLEAGDTITAYSSAASSIDAVASYLV